MTRPSVNLRNAFAANPTRFLAVPSPRPAMVSRLPTKVPLSQIPPAPQQAAAAPHALPDRLRRLGLRGMARSFASLATDAADIAPLAGWLSLLVEDEVAERKRRRVAARLRAARLRYAAPMAEIDYNAVRGFDDALFHWLANGQWIDDRDNLVIDGPPGTGKTWLACALGEQACRDDRSVRYERVPELLADLEARRGADRYAPRIRGLQGADLLILDDWGLQPFSPPQRRDLLEIAEARYGRGSILIASPVPVEAWRETIGDAALAAV
ncbi:MAG: ATP-binding protein, partial [Stellaceae bacterium]